MNKYSVLAVGIAIIMGFMAGMITTTNTKNKEMDALVKKYEQELLDQAEQSKAKIDSVRLKIIYIEKQLAQDSVLIMKLKYQIRADGVRYQKELDKIKNLSPHEKASWLINRYSADSVQH